MGRQTRRETEICEIKNVWLQRSCVYLLAGDLCEVVVSDGPRLVVGVRGGVHRLASSMVLVYRRQLSARCPAVYRFRRHSPGVATDRRLPDVAASASLFRY